MAYPLWMQFSGPMHTPNAPFAPQSFFADLASFTPFSPLSLAGSPAAGRLSTSADRVQRATWGSRCCSWWRRA